MSKLILSLDGQALKEFRLNKERMLIGRKPANDIQIDNIAVSGEHAAVVTILNDSFLEDLGSTNGTKVNGNAIKKAVLKNYDVIEIGKYKLTYISESSEKSSADFEKTRMLRPKEAVAMIPSVVSAPSSPPPAPKSVESPAPAQPMAVIQLLSGASAGRELNLVKNLTTIGKPGIQVAAITRRPQGYFITHVEGTMLPVVNGKEIGLQPHPLSDHDILELLNIKMEFFLK